MSISIEDNHVEQIIKQQKIVAGLNLNLEERIKNVLTHFIDFGDSDMSNLDIMVGRIIDIIEFVIGIPVINNTPRNIFEDRYRSRMVTEDEAGLIDQIIDSLVATYDLPVKGIIKARNKIIESLKMR